MEQTKVEVKLPSKPRIIYSPLAWTKQTLLILSQSGEVGWHGIVENKGNNVFVITDILVYPQMVSSATVTTDELTYSNWLGGQPDDIFPKIRAHFHSHVNMGVTPSGVDEKDKESIVSQMREGRDYYIFMIWNKRFEFSADIYDAVNGVRFGAKDITVEIEGLGEINAWLEKATENITEKKEVKQWIWQKVTSSLIHPNSPTVVKYTSSAAGQWDQRSSSYSRDWDYQSSSYTTLTK